MIKASFFLCTLLFFSLFSACSDQKTIPPKNTDRMNVLIYLQEGVEILDFAGPVEVFSYAGFEVHTVTADGGAILSQGIVKVLPEYSIETAPQADIICFFGGNGIASSKNKAVTDWLRRQAPGCQYLFSVCTGAFFMGEAGLLDGQKATTFHESLEELQERFPACEVLPETRWVDNGKLVTTAGVSAGIDGALHLVSKIKGPDAAKEAAFFMEYDRWDPTDGLVVPQ